MRLLLISLITFITFFFLACHTNVDEKIPLVDQTNINVDSTSMDSNQVNVILSYRFKDDPFAERLQKLFTNFLTSAKKRENLNHYFNWKMHEFMEYPSLHLHGILKTKGMFDPMITAIYTDNRNDTIVKIHFNMQDHIGNVTPLATVNFPITNYYGLLQLRNSVYLNSKNWKTKQVGNIQYFYPDSHIFSQKEAQKMNEFNKKLANLYQKEEVKLRYFITESNIELQQLLGFDYRYDMFNMNNSSGLADIVNKIIYAGNGSEFYPHELVHLYNYAWEGAFKYHSWFNEGFATFLGGSRNENLDWHLSALKRYLVKENFPDLSNPFSLPHQVTDTTSPMYAIGGLICKVAYEKNGMEAIHQLLMKGNTNEDFYQGIEEVLCVERECLNDFLYEEINQSELTKTK